MDGVGNDFVHHDLAHFGVNDSGLKLTDFADGHAQEADQDERNGQNHEQDDEHPAVVFVHLKAD